MSRWRKCVRKWRNRGKRWKAYYFGCKRTIRQQLSQINDLAEREAAALNQAEAYRQQVRELDESLHALLAWQRWVREAWESYAVRSDLAHREMPGYQHLQRAIKDDAQPGDAQPDDLFPQVEEDEL